MFAPGSPDLASASSPVYRWNTRTCPTVEGDKIEQLNETKAGIELTSTSASSQSSRGIFFSSGILGSLRSPNDWAIPIKSSFLTRKMYEASCLEYALTNETNASA